MAVTDEKTEDAELYQVAHMYYDLDMMQSEIADKLFYSRSKVSRLLKLARELGIVQITVKRIFDRVETVEKTLCSLFGLKSAVVISSDDDSPAEALRVLTDFAALHISKLLTGSCTIGITSGSTVNQVIGKLKNLNGCRLKVVQLMGAVSSSYQSEESHALVNRMLDNFGGVAHYLNSPLYIDDLYAKNILMQDSTVKAVFRQMESCTVILTGIGALESDSGVRPDWQGYMSRRHCDELMQKGAAGSICAQYFDIGGNLIPCEWNAKCVVMPLENMRRCPAVIGVARGSRKVRSILGALRGGHISALITDVPTALEVINLNGASDSAVSEGGGN